MERVRLHQVAAGRRKRDLLLRALFDDPVVATVTAVDPTAEAVHLHDGATLAYDTLVDALGSLADTTSVPGVAEHAHTVASYPAAVRLRDAVRGPVTVVGGGLTGIETAAELAAAHPGLPVSLVTAGVIGAGIGDRGRRYLHARLARLGVTVHEGLRVAAVTADGVAGLPPSATVVWAAGFRVPPIAAEAGIAVDADGRVVVDGWLRSTSHPDVYAIGDAAAARTGGAGDRVARMSCQTAMPMGLRVAGVIGARIAGRAPRPVRLRHVWQNVGLGRTDALTQFVRADDSPVDALLTGRVAAAFKEAVTRGTVTMLRR